MDTSDIKYALELLNDALSTKDWDGIYDAKEFLMEFLDNSSELEE